MATTNKNKDPEKLLVNKELYDSLYFATVYFTVGSFKALPKWYKKFKITDMDEGKGAVGMCETIIMHHNDGKESDQFHLHLEGITDWQTLVHEVTHLTMKIFNSRGVPISLANQEGFAYYHEMWTRRMWKIMCEAKKGKSCTGKLKKKKTPKTSEGVKLLAAGTNGTLQEMSKPTSSS